jgi:hypothetical protein
MKKPMKKRLNTDAIKNELEGSVFFPTPMQPLSSPQSQEGEQPNKAASHNVNNSTSKHVNIATSQHVYKSTTQLTTKEKKRFTSFLTPESIKQLRQKALDAEADFHDLLQEAVDRYLEEKRKK